MATFAGARHKREPLETHGAGGPALHVLSAIAGRQAALASVSETIREPLEHLLHKGACSENTIPGHGNRSLSHGPPEISTPTAGYDLGSLR